MPRQRLALVRNQEQDGLAWLTAADDAIIVCRGSHHDWPRIIPHVPIPRNVSVRPQRDGCVRMVEYCGGDCGTSRWKETRPGGVWDRDAHYRYEYDADRYRSPKDSGVSRGDAAQELFRRNQEALMALARRPSAVPVPVFQTGG